MFWWLWDCLLLIKVDLGQHPLTHLPPTSQQTILPWPNIMVGSRWALQWGSAIFQVRDPIFWLKVSNTCSILGKLRNRSKVEVANWASGVKVTWPISKKIKKSDFLNFGQRCLGWFWLIERLSVLAQIDVWMALGLSNVDQSWSETTSNWHICRRPANRPFCLDPI